MVRLYYVAKKDIALFLWFKMQTESGRTWRPQNPFSACAIMGKPISCYITPFILQQTSISVIESDMEGKAQHRALNILLVCSHGTGQMSRGGCLLWYLITRRNERERGEDERAETLNALQSWQFTLGSAQRTKKHYN